MMRKCENCNCQLEDSAAFCSECGITVKNKVCENPSESVTKKTVAETEKQSPRKGIKNLGWNLKNMKNFEPKENIKISLKVALILIPIILIAVVAIVIVGFTISDIIENSKRYTYMSTEAFIENWNSAAVENPNGITQGFVIEDDDIDYEIYTLNDTDEIKFHTSGADIIYIEFSSSVYLEDEYNRYEKIEELILICFPDCNQSMISGYIEKYKEHEDACAISGILGVRFTFEELEKKSTPKLSIETIYSYSEYIINSELPWGCSYDCTLEEYKKSFNSKVDYLFGDYSVSPVSNFVVAEELIVMGRGVTTYCFDCVINGQIVANAYLKVDDESGKIFYCEYLLQDSHFDSDAEMVLYLKTLPTCIFSSLGFDEEIVYDLYITKALDECVAENNYTVSFIGTNIHAAEVGNGWSSMSFFSCSDEYSEQLKKEGNVSIYSADVTSQTKTTEETSLKTTGIPTESVVVGDETPTSNIQIPQGNNSFLGKTFVNAGDYSPACDYSLVNSIAFTSDKAMLQINLMECIVTVEADYTISGNNIILGEVLTEVGDVMIEEGAQFTLDTSVLTVNGMAERFVLNGWTCPYQFNDGEDFIEVEM